MQLKMAISKWARRKKRRACFSDLPEGQALIFILDIQRVSVKLTDILLSNTGIRYTFDSPHGTVEPFGGITVVLKNGARIEDGQGTGTVEDDLTTRNYVWNWSIPLNIEDITSVIIGGTEIQVNTD